MTENEIAEIVVDTSIAIHRSLGPGIPQPFALLHLCVI
jgi:hypothetical protein